MINFVLGWVDNDKSSITSKPDSKKRKLLWQAFGFNILQSIVSDMFVYDYKEMIL